MDFLVIDSSGELALYSADELKNGIRNDVTFAKKVCLDDVTSAFHKQTAVVKVNLKNQLESLKKRTTMAIELVSGVERGARGIVDGKVSTKSKKIDQFQNR